MPREVLKNGWHSNPDICDLTPFTSLKKSLTSTGFFRPLTGFNSFKGQGAESLTCGITDDRGIISLETLEAN